jgi:hypothetical protein
VAADRYQPGPRPPGSAAALFDFLEDALQLFQLIPDLVDSHAVDPQGVDPHAVDPEPGAGQKCPGK